MSTPATLHMYEVWQTLQLILELTVIRTHYPYRPRGASFVTQCVLPLFHSRV